MAAEALHFARGDIQSGEQRGRAVARRGSPLRLPGSQQRLRAVEGLHLAFLVDARARSGGSKPTTSRTFLDEQRIQLEGFAAMGFRAKGMPDAMEGA